MLQTIVMTFLIILSICDIRERKIPVVFLTGGVISVIVYEAAVVAGGGSLKAALLGAVPGIVITAAAFITGKIGTADGIVLAALGAINDYRSIVSIISISMVLMAVLSLLLLMFHKIKKNSELPYIPFVTAAYLICMCV